MVLVKSLRVFLLLGLAALAAGVVASVSASGRLGLPTFDAPPPDAAAGHVIQLATDVEILRTRRGAPTVSLHALESRTYMGGMLILSDVTFRLFGPDGRETVVLAPRAESALPVERTASTRTLDAVGSWQLKGGVTLRTAGDLVLEAPTLVFLEEQGIARTDDEVTFTRGPASGKATGMSYGVGSQQVRLLGNVDARMEIVGMGLTELKARSAVYDLRSASFEMSDYRAATSRGELLSGKRLLAEFREAGGITRLQGLEGFTLESTHAAPVRGPRSPLERLLALEGTRVIRGRTIAVRFGASSEPVSIEVAGNANLTASNGGAAGRPSSIAAETLTFDLIDGNLTRARAAGDVDLKGAPAEGESAGFHLLSEHLDAAFDPNLGSILKLEGQGQIQLSDQGMESQGSRTFLDPNTDVVTLSGESDRPAVATWLGRRIQAQRIEADRRRKTLTGRGGVRASYRPPEAAPGGLSSPPGQALPFFRGGETIYAMAGLLTFSDQGKLARYRDRVRIWQGENRVEAAEVDLNETTGSLEARGDVISSFRQPPPPSRSDPTNPSDQIVTIASSGMRYEKAAGTVTYTGRVLVTQGPMRVTADSLVVVMASDGGAAESMRATGGVEMKDSGRLGRGDRLDVDMRASTLKLTGTGREAIVQDESGQQVVRGRSLTMDRAGDRILVESELGGRTWITLKPRQKGAPGVGSDPRN